MTTSEQVVHTTGPYSQEAEEAVLGSVLVNPAVFMNLSAFLAAEDFFLLRHTKIWEAMARLTERGDAIDYLTVVQELRDMSWLDEVGGESYLIRLVNNTPSSVHAEVYGRMVERAAIRRRLVETADEIKKLAYDEEKALESVMNEAEAQLFDISESTQVRREFVPLRDAISEYYDRMEYLLQNREARALGVPSGFRDIDQLLGGFQKSDLIVFAGRPGMGKCVTAGTTVLTGTGPVPIESLLPDSAGIPDDEGGIYYPLDIPVQTPLGTRRTAYVYDSGQRQTRQIQTLSGHQLAGTYVHPVMSRSHRGIPTWKTLAELTPGDPVAIQHGDSVGWDVVVSVEDTGIQPCYDLVVPDGHMFIANGIVSHNTSFMLSVALNAARLAGIRIAIFTMEMGVEQMVQRLIAMETGINMQKLRLADLNQPEIARFTEAIGRIADLPLYIDDTPALNPVQLRTKVRRLSHEYGVDMIMLDYMQLMNSGRGRDSGNRVQEMSYISRALKELAREMNVPLFSAAQLSRAVEQRPDKRPVLSDLRESGSIEQDSDVVMFLYRDVVYNDETEFPNQADILVSKHRNGPTGTIQLYFDRSITKFVDTNVRNVDLSDFG